VLAGSADTPVLTAAGGRSRPRLRMGLARKLGLAFIGLVSSVLLVNGGLDMWLGYHTAKASAIGMQRQQAGSVAERIEGFISDIEQQIGWTTTPHWDALPLEGRRYDFIRLLREVPAISEITEIDGSGTEELQLSRTAADVVASGKSDLATPRFAEAEAKGTWFSPVYFRNQSEPYMTIAVAHAGRHTGVTVAEVNLKFIWDVITTMQVGRTGYAFVVDSRGRLIAHPDLSIVLRNTDLAHLPQVAAALAELRRNLPAGGAETAIGPSGGTVLTAFAPVARLGWVVFVELPLAEALAPVYASLLRQAALLAFGVLLAAIASGALARRMVIPIRRLQSGAERLGSGERSQPIEIRTGDEIETLAERFNQMAAKVQESHDTLEAKVEARTKALRAQEQEAQEARLTAEQALADLRRAQDRLIETQKLASLGQLTAGIAHEIKNPLNFVNNFADLSGDLVDELDGALADHGKPLGDRARAEIGDIARMLKINLAKIAEHGRRADSIVKNMLAHSRTGTGEHRPVELNATVDEALNLAYHGARAEHGGFNVTLCRDYDPAAGRLDLYPQEFTRVLLNIFGNCFYAVDQRRLGASEPGYAPTLWVTTRNLGVGVEIRIRDNGTGIPEAVKAKIFEPFFTTKPTGAGTGLGLSLSYDIIVKQHGGTLTADSKLGEFTEFVITLPRAMAPAAVAGAGEGR
jgi:two-component system, NtrC family, sensor kinase